MIGIIGCGVVGNAIYYWLSKNHDVVVHDTKLDTSLNDLIEKTNIAYICVPTPQSVTSGDADISIIHEIFSQLPDGFQVVVKSTIPPGSTNLLSKQYPKLTIAYSPEFLVDRNAVQDYGNQDLLVVGSNNEQLAETVFQHHITANLVERSQCFWIEPNAAELLKYSRNLFYSIKVVYSNQMYDICNQFGVDWSEIKNLLTATNHQQIGPSHLDPMHGEFRGFGGKCLPKDIAALTHLAERKDVKYDLLDAIVNDNANLREKPTKPPQILITGAAGLIGTSAKTEFEKRGWLVRTLDKIENDLDGRPIDFVGDIVEYENLNQALIGVDGVLHLAAVSRVIDAELNKEECTRVNVDGTRRLLEAASDAMCRWFIFGSSREVYGEPTTLPVSEENGVAPINHYGHAKVLGEKMVKTHCEINGMVHSILRFSNVYGHSGDHQTRLVNAFILKALKAESLEIHGGGQIFDFTHIDDTTGAIFSAAKLLHEKHEHIPPIHVLPGEAVAIEDLAAMILQITSSDSEIIFTPGRDYDVEKFHGDPSRMNEVLGYECSIGIKTGLEKCVKLHSERILLEGANKE